MTAILRAALLAALLALAAAAPVHASAQGVGTAGAVNEVFLTTRPVSRTDCRVSNRPLPPVDALLDSAALDARLREYVAAHHFGGGDSLHLVLSVGFGERGEAVRARPIQWYLPQGAPEAMGGMVNAALKHQRRQMDVRLRIDLAGQPAFLVSGAEVCRPRGMDGVDIDAPVLAGVEAPRPVRVRITVGVHGEVLGSVIVSSSGQRYWDDIVTDFINRTRFVPGLIDGEPQVMDYETTIRFHAH